MLGALWRGIMLPVNFVGGPLVFLALFLVFAVFVAVSLVRFVRGASYVPGQLADPSPHGTGEL